MRVFSVELVINKACKKAGVLLCGRSLCGPSCFTVHRTSGEALVGAECGFVVQAGCLAEIVQWMVFLGLRSTPRRHKSTL